MVNNQNYPFQKSDTKNMPKELTKTEQESKMKMKMWEMRVKKYLERKEVLTENANKLYGIVIGKCTPTLRLKIKGDAEYGGNSSDFDTLWLLNKIKNTTADVDTKTNPAITLHEKMLIFMTTRQGQLESDDDYLNKFNSRLENMILAGCGHLFCSSQILGKDMVSCTKMEINTEKERFKAKCFILRADEIRYGDHSEDLRKEVYRGRDEYPTTVPDVYELLLRKSQQIGYNQRQTVQSGHCTQMGGKGEGFMLVQQGGHGGHGGCGKRGSERRKKNNHEEVAGRNEILHGGVRCYSCQRHGNYSDQCPNQTDAILTQVGVALTQHIARIKNTWVLLDTCATNSVSNNTALVTDIVACKQHKRLTVSTN